jgi:hypothetical protein
MFTQEQRDRVRAAVESIAYHDLKARPYRFYLVDEFVDTDIEKTSPGGLRSPQYLDLAEITQSEFDVRKGYSISDVANMLLHKRFT